MTSTALTLHEGGSVLTLSPEQQFWNEKQVATLKSLGVSPNATNGDLAVFMHVCQRTGLDPFARQIYMIERDGKQTIQTGIDGFRLVARRAADKAEHSLSIGEAFWCGNDGAWTDIWLSNDAPAAAKVTVVRDGGDFPGKAIYREYVQTKRGGEVTAMWKNRPAGQLAKCAEALALRKAFPQDLSGVYVDAEMQNQDRRYTATVEQPKSASERVRALVVPGEPVAPDSVKPDAAAPDFDEPPMTKAQRGRIFAQFAEMGVTDDQLMRDYMTNVLERPVTEGEQGRASLTLVEADRVIEAQKQELQPEVAS